MARDPKKPRLPPYNWSHGTPSPAFNKLYRPLGYVVVTFADMEQMLGFVLAELLHRPYVEILALESLVQGTQTRIQFFYFLAIQATSSLAQSNPKHKEAFEKMGDSAKHIFRALQQANDDRNNLLHSPWTGIGTLTERSYSKDRFTARDGKLKEIPIRGITKKLLDDEAKYFISIRLRLLDWVQRMIYSDRPESWPALLPDKYLLSSPLNRLIQAHNKRDA